jgi:hypothetical protein
VIDFVKFVASDDGNMGWKFVFALKEPAENQLRKARGCDYRARGKIRAMLSRPAMEKVMQTVHLPIFQRASAMNLNDKKRENIFH